MVDLAESSRPINVVTLVEELDQHKELEAVGDVVYVSSLIDGVREKMTRAGLRRSMEQAFNVESIRPERYDFPENGTAESSRYSVV
jgi:replicative DNA helicase